MQKIRFVLLLATLGLLVAFIGKPDKTTVYLVGDSTMSNKEKKAYPETGWGMPFAGFFDSTVVMDNRAKNGRSTKSFIAENLWQPVVDALQPGDYVFIQFGHNDEAKEKAERYATPELYKKNLRKFVNETKSKGAIPVLLTPVSRRRFDSAGRALPTHAAYSPLVAEVAKEQGIAFIDLDEKSRAMYQQLGAQTSTLLFLQLLPGEHSNYPDGKIDNTHFNELGARKIAQLVLQQVRNLHLGLAKQIVVPVPAK